MQVRVIIAKLSCLARQIFNPLEIVSVTLAPRRTSTVDSTATGLAFGVSAQTKQPGEMISLNSLPAAVQETIKDKAAGDRSGKKGRRREW